MDTLFYRIALTKTELIGPVTARTLVSYCGSAQAVFESSKKALLKIPGIGVTLFDNLHKVEPYQEAEAEIAIIESNADASVLWYADESYPSRLKQFPDSPTLLYMLGSLDLNHDKMVSIVGTRTPTERGKIFCDSIVEELSHFRPIIISGFAYGIDITAHLSSIKYDLPTIAILANGFNKIYPQDHQQHIQKILSTGALLSEYGFEVKAEREHFPMRNRIIAAISDALIVVETKNKGGSMITAELANGYNKDVFAIPGRLNDKYSAGCNQLIKVHKANLLESSKDIAYIMGWEKNKLTRKAVQQSLFVNLNEKEQIIYNLLTEHNDLTIDRIVRESAIPSSKIASLLLQLEMKGVLNSLPGKRYSLI